MFGPNATLANTDQREAAARVHADHLCGNVWPFELSCLDHSLERRFSSGLTFLGGYSWQKSLDILSNTAFEGNGNAYPYGQIENDYGPSNFDRRHRLTASFNYVLPSKARVRWA